MEERGIIITVSRESSVVRKPIYDSRNKPNSEQKDERSVSRDDAMKNYRPAHKYFKSIV